MKIGRECEGRFRGLLTLFMDASEALDFFNRPSLKVACKNEEARNLIEKVRHIYISDHTNALRADDDCIQEWNRMGFVVCIERTSVACRHLWPSCVSFLLVVQPPPGLWQLDGNDQIKFTSPDRKVLSAVVRTMDVTQPDEFNHDIEVQL